MCYSDIPTSGMFVLKRTTMEGSREGRSHPKHSARSLAALSKAFHTQSFSHPAADPTHRLAFHFGVSATAKTYGRHGNTCSKTTLSYYPPTDGQAVRMALFSEANRLTRPHSPSCKWRNAAPGGYLAPDSIGTHAQDQHLTLEQPFSHVPTPNASSPRSRTAARAASRNRSLDTSRRRQGCTCRAPILLVAAGGSSGENINDNDNDDEGLGQLPVSISSVGRTPMGFARGLSWERWLAQRANAK